MDLHIVNSSFTTRSGLKPVPNEPSMLDLKPQTEKGVILIPPELTPLPEIEILKTNTDLLQEITTHPDGVRINQTVFVDPDFLKRQYLKVFRAYLDRAEKTPSRSKELIEQGLSYVEKRDAQLAKQLAQDTDFVKKRRESLESEKKEATKGVSVRDQIVKREAEEIEFKVKEEIESPKIQQEQKDNLSEQLMLNLMTVPQLKAELRKQGIPFKSKTRKADLINLLR